MHGRSCRLTGLTLISLSVDASDLKYVVYLTVFPHCMECQRGLAMRKVSVCLAVRLSVCLSVKRVHCDKTEEKSVKIFIPHERSFILVF